jgi:hypothetical protein
LGFRVEHHHQSTVWISTSFDDRDEEFEGELDDDDDDGNDDDNDDEE